jgi:hypothetical protein
LKGTGTSSPPPERRAPLPLQGLQKGFQHYQRNAVRHPQATPAGYLAAIAVFCNEVKAKSGIALTRSYTSAFVLLPKLREAMAEEMCGRVVGGEGKEAEVDGEVDHRSARSRCGYSGVRR